MKQLKLSIKPKQEPTEGQSLNSSGYSVKINDWELGRGVTGFRLEMPANGKPKITIDFTPDIIETNGVVVDPQVLEAFDQAYSDFIAKTQSEKEKSDQKQQKAPDGNQALNKIIQGNYNMKRKKEQWKPKIVNIMADGSQVDDLTGYVIPAGHSYYDIILGMNKRSNEEGVA